MNDLQVSSFWSKVDVGTTTKECWPWIGALASNGYGNVRVNKKYLKAHRVAFELANGEIPEGYLVCHTCDNRKCCNPSHLMLGTTKSNAADMLIKGRGKKPESAARGVVNGMSKLTDSDVLDIRERYSNEEVTQYELASEYGVSQPAIGSIVLNKTWRHLL